MAASDCSIFSASARSTASADFSRAEIAAAGALVDYVELTQKGRVPRLDPPRQMAQGSVMEIDAATRRNLELTRSPDRRAQGLPAGRHRPHGDRRRRPAAGGTAGRPLDRPREIGARLDMVGSLGRRGPDARRMRGRCCASCPDMERALVAPGARARRPARSRRACATGWRGRRKCAACSPTPGDAGGPPGSRPPARRSASTPP